MEAAGWIRRNRSSADRGGVEIAITEKGTRTLAHVWRIIARASISTSLA
jgi:DNA-binding MarR family transcriptional regulator